MILKSAKTDLNSAGIPLHDFSWLLIYKVK